MNDLHFMHLLLICSKNQARALLETSDKNQVKSLVVLLFNLEKNKEIIPTKAKSLVKTYNSIFKKLQSNRMQDKKNYSLISKNWLKIHKILLAAKPVLLNILK